MSRRTRRRVEPTRLLSRLLIVCVVLLPMVWALGYAMLTSVGSVGRMSDGWTIEHWHKTLVDGQVLKTIGYSLYVSIVVSLVVTAGAISIVLTMVDRLSSLLAVSLLGIQLGTPVIVVGLLASQILSGGGLLSRVLHRLGWLDSPTNFPSLVNDWWGVGIIVGLCFVWLPLAVLYFFQIWKSAGVQRQCGLAESLGAGVFQAKLKIAIPILLIRGRSMIALMFLMIFGSYEIPLILGRQSPQMISVAVQQRSGLYDLKTRPEAYVLAVIYFVVCASILILYLRGRSGAR